MDGVGEQNVFCPWCGRLSIIPALAAQLDIALICVICTGVFKLLARPAMIGQAMAVTHDIAED